MKRFSKYILFITLLSSFTSCLIENDMSYPKVEVAIEAFDVKGQVKSEINLTQKTVDIELQEDANIADLEITAFGISEGASCNDADIYVGSHIDLSSPRKVILHMYQDHEWTVSATLPIERYIRCDGQAAAASFDVEDRTATLYVTQEEKLSAITVTEIKLGRAGAQYYHIDSGSEQMITGPITIDCTSPVTFRVKNEGISEDWTMKVVRKDIKPAIVSATPWCKSVDITGEYLSSEGKPVIEYKAESDTGWKTADADIEDTEYVQFSTTVTGLMPSTKYSIRVKLGSDTGENFEFTTGTPVQIYNMGFEDWRQDGKTWYPAISDKKEHRIWDTANKGVTILSDSPTFPVDETATGSSRKAAKLTNKFAFKFAAGNILTGEFVDIILDGETGAILNWGIPFTEKPTELKGYYSYKPGTIDYVENKKTSTTELDKCQILVMLTDWGKPFEINTSKGKFVDQEKDPHIIAYGKLESDTNTSESVNPKADPNGYIPFSIKLDYRRPDATPKYVVIVACASYKGDLFTGSTQSEMKVDEFEFVYGR